MLDMMQGHAMLASPMTPLMHHPPQHTQYGSPYPHPVLGPHMPLGGWNHPAYSPSTPQAAGGYPALTPQQNSKPMMHADSPGSNQPYTCYICNATATSRKNYVAHLQVCQLQGFLLPPSPLLLPLLHFCNGSTTAAHLHRSTQL